MMGKKYQLHKNILLLLYFHILFPDITTNQLDWSHACYAIASTEYRNRNRGTVVFSSATVPKVLCFPPQPPVFLMQERSTASHRFCLKTSTDTKQKPQKYFDYTLSACSLIFKLSNIILQQVEFLSNFCGLLDPGDWERPCVIRIRADPYPHHCLKRVSVLTIQSNFKGFTQAIKGFKHRLIIPRGAKCIGLLDS